MQLVLVDALILVAVPMFVSFIAGIITGTRTIPTNETSESLAYAAKNEQLMKICVIIFIVTFMICMFIVAVLGMMEHDRLVSTVT